MLPVEAPVAPSWPADTPCSQLGDGPGSCSTTPLSCLPLHGLELLKHRTPEMVCEGIVWFKLVVSTERSEHCWVPTASSDMTEMPVLLATVVLLIEVSRHSVNNSPLLPLRISDKEHDLVWLPAASLPIGLDLPAADRFVRLSSLEFAPSVESVESSRETAGASLRPVKVRVHGSLAFFILLMTFEWVKQPITSPLIKANVSPTTIPANWALLLVE